MSNQNNKEIISSDAFEDFIKERGFYDAQEFLDAYYDKFIEMIETGSAYFFDEEKVLITLTIFKEK
jgi:hypothetical protein